jgi:putative PEP-CTERM system TPR-repeat lipoprotein
MSKGRFIGRSAAAIAIFVVALLAGCGNETPESMVASAKRYLASNDYPAAVIQLQNALQKTPNLGEARLLLGTALIETGDIAGAEKELRRALKLGEPTDRVHPPLARALMHLGEHKKVVDQFDGEDLGDPARNAELLTAVGHSRLALRERQAAQAAFSKALELRPAYPPALLGNARLKASAGDFPGALALIQAALDASPKLLEAQNFQADVLAVSGQHDAAIAAYRKSLELRPKHVPAHAAIVALLIQQQKLDDAGKQLDELKRLAPKHPETFYLRASYEYRRNNLAVAREAIQLHLNAAPNNVRGLLLASAIEHDLKSYAQSEAYLLRVLESAPGLAPARRLLVTNYLRSGQHSKAIETLKPLLDTAGNDSGTLALAGEAFLVSGNASEAAFYFAKASELDPKDHRKLTGLALSHLAQGKADDAFRELEQASAMATDDRAALALIMAALQRRDFDKALAAIDALEKKQPGKPLPHNLRGTALLGKRDVDAARKSFERALAIDPAFFPAAANLARLDLVDKKPEEARKRFESVLAKNPKSTESLLALAELRARNRAPADEVTSLIVKAIAINPAAIPPRLALVNYYLNSNQPSKAAAAAQDALAANPDRPEILEAAGRAYHASGANNQALSTYSKWARIQPKSPAPLVRMADVHMAGKEYDAAAGPLRKALELKPDYLEAQRRLVTLDIRRERIPQALETARTVQKQRAKEVAGYLLEGDVYSATKAWPQAVAAYRSGLKQVDSVDLAIRMHVALRAAKSKEADQFAAERLRKYPDQTAFRIYLAESTLAVGEYSTSIEHYKTLLAAQPDNALLLNNLAFAAGRVKDPNALAYAEKAAKLAPNNPAIMDTLGVLLVDSGDTARGIEMLRKAAGMPPQIPGIRLNLAKSLIKTGQKPAARQELEQLAKLGNKFAGNAEVERLLKEL